MPTFDPDDLALWARGTWNHVPPQRIEGFSIDTRKIDKGELFYQSKIKGMGMSFLKLLNGWCGQALVSSRDDKLSFPQLLASDTLDSLQGMRKNIERHLQAL